MSTFLEINISNNHILKIYCIIKDFDKLNDVQKSNILPFFNYINSINKNYLISNNLTNLLSIFNKLYINKFYVKLFKSGKFINYNDDNILNSVDCIGDILENIHLNVSLDNEEIEICLNNDGDVFINYFNSINTILNNSELLYNKFSLIDYQDIYKSLQKFCKNILFKNRFKTDF